MGRWIDLWFVFKKGLAFPSYTTDLNILPALPTAMGSRDIRKKVATTKLRSELREMASPADKKRKEYCSNCSCEDCVAKRQKTQK